MISISYPGETPSKEYYECRYSVLRHPLGFARGAEILTDDSEAIHAWIASGAKIVAVGRSHLIPNESDGTGSDHGGPNAAKIPGFGPLADISNRPAIQIRQMGTLVDFRRKGFAAIVLNHLENHSKAYFSAKVGFLQAREHAIPFYSSQGWKLIDEPYEIKGIGPHRSMMKYLK
tara:strand:+ start:2815 stop:3336 length:522 start_codon:yes stop_codon:yes gene_type:complete